MPTTVTPIPPLDRNSPTFRAETNLYFGTRIPTFTTEINAVADELMDARDETVAARDESVPLANQVITLAPQAIAASMTVQTLAPQVAANAAQVQADKAQVATMVAGATQVQMGGSTGYPTIGPSLICNFAHAQRLSRKLTFTRAGAATYVDQLGRLRTAASGMPVFEFNAAGRSLGYRSEPARTNSIRYSEQFENAAWTKFRAAISANAVVAPDGILAADVLVESTEFGAHRAEQNISSTAGTLVTISVFARPAGRTQFNLFDAISAKGMKFDLANQAVSASDVAGISASSAWAISALPGGWVRCSITFTSTGVASSLSVILSNGTTGSYVGDGVSGIAFWGGQWEVGASPTSYIPTTATALTRPADALTLPAAAAADVLNPAQGTFVVEFTLNSVPSGSDVFEIWEYSNGTGAERISLRVSATSLYAVMATAGGTFVAVTPSLAGTPQSGVRYRIAVGYSVAGLRGSGNGGAAINAAASTAPALAWNQLSISSARGASVLNGHTAQLYPYPRLLTDAELIAVSRL